MVHKDFFSDFEKISEHFLKIFEDFQKIIWRPDVSEYFPKIFEVNWKLLNTSKQDL